MVQSLAAHGHIDTERPTDGRRYTVATPGTARNGDPLQSVAHDEMLVVWLAVDRTCGSRVRSTGQNLMQQLPPLTEVHFSLSLLSVPSVAACEKQTARVFGSYQKREGYVHGITLV